jgi:hypothetical protein
MFKQASKVIAKFGGVQRLAALLKRDPSGIYRWEQTRLEGGTDGIIPASAMPSVLEAADALGIEITAEDLDPRP